MKGGDSVVGLGLVLLVAAVLYSATMESTAVRGGQSGSMPDDGGAVGAIAILLILGLIGRWWIRARSRARAAPERRIAQRRRALPPPPDVDGEH